MYWRYRDREVDYVVRSGKNTWAIEVKSGRPRPVLGLAAFRDEYPKARLLTVGSGGIDLEEFLSRDPRELLS